MKFLTFLFLLALSFTISPQLSAQTNRYIEITAVDTIVLKPIEFTYEITLGRQSFPFKIKADDSMRNAVPLIDIENLLTKNKFNFEVKDKSSYSITPDNKPDSFITLRLSTESDVKRLYNILIKVQGISGRIIDAKFESLSKYKDEMHKRLFAKALQDANDLAKLSGNSVGQLISVHEPQSDFLSGMMDSYKEMFNKNEMFSQLFGLKNAMTQQIEARLIFKFEMK